MSTSTGQRSVGSIKSTLKAYSLPLILLAGALFFQLVVLPRNYPPSHYEVLGIPRYSSVEEVTAAYENINAKWNASADVPPTVDLFKVQYAFELLTNELLKRDYDIYNIDEHSHLLEKVKEGNLGKHISEFNLPLIKLTPFDPADRDIALINTDNFLSKFEDDKALLVQIISFGSSRSAELSTTWKRAVYFLNGVVNSGVVELGEVNLVGYLAERKPSGQPFFRNGLPALLAFPPGCKSSSCLQRFGSDLTVDAITDWVATEILNLPRIPYHSKESLVHNLAKSKPHQIKVILISKTGERAAPFVRQAAKNYLPYFKFAFALWKEEDSAFWWKMFGVESAPAIVILKDPGVEPVVYRGTVNTSMFTDILEKNKHHVLPQLRNLTSAELGCDARGYSRAGNDTKIWYCAIVAGRPSQELNKMRETMRRVQEKLSNQWEDPLVDEDPLLAPSSIALRQKRLTFAWLDGEAQNRYCFFHIHSEDSFETCGPQRTISDVARLFIVRYERNDEDEKQGSQQQRERNILASWHQSEADPTSSLVAKYNGSNEIPDIMVWISQTIRDGDSRNVSPFKTRTPSLVPEDNGETWTRSSKKLIPSGVNLKQGTRSFISGASDRLSDPRIGPSLLLVALLAFGRIWLKRSRPAPSTADEDEHNQTQDRSDIPREWRERRRDAASANWVIPPTSVADEQPDSEPESPK